MTQSAEIMIVDYESITPRHIGNIFTNGFHIRKVRSNADALAQASGLDIVILIANERKRECVKLMEQFRERRDPSVSFIVILNGPDDPTFRERIDGMTFQCFRKGRFSDKDLSKAIFNALEMRNLKMREKRFVQDLDRIEGELKRVEHRLYTINTIKSAVMKEGSNYLN